MSLVWQPVMTLSDVERIVIEEAYKFYGRNKTATANALGIAIRTLDSRFEQYSNKKPENKTGNENTNSGLAVEQSVEATSQQTVSMRKRKKI